MAIHPVKVFQLAPAGALLAFTVQQAPRHRINAKKDFMQLVPPGHVVRVQEHVPHRYSVKILENVASEVPNDKN